MDTLYIGDIPQEYHYAIFSDEHIDLYNTNNLSNNTYTFYRIYKNLEGFYYSVETRNIPQFQSVVAQDISVSSNLCYRSDFSHILFITFIFCFFGIFLLNIITSLIRKGGILGGLL